MKTPLPAPRPGQRPAEPACQLRRRVAALSRQNAHLRRACRRAESASQAKSDFLARMSHEIRTPLSAVLNLLDLTRQSRLDPQQQEYVHLMQTAGQSLLAVLNESLDFARLEAGRMSLEGLRFPLPGTVQDIVRLFAAQARQKGLQLRCQIAPEVPATVIGDPQRLGQILGNLINNAIKFTQAGEIVVTVDRLADDEAGVHCLFGVRDSGIGIPPEKQAALFSPFQQADASIARRYGGSGLGLTIAARLVQLMQGSLWVESTPGEGSHFRFTARFASATSIALQQADDMPATCPPHARLTVPSLRTVLLVEDNATNRRITQLVLENEGHRVLLADSAASAAALLARDMPDLVLMDLQLPDMDGIAATALLRHQAAASGYRLPVVALTAHAGAADQQRCLAGGMDDYLCKPLAPAALAAICQRLAREAARPVLDPGVLLPQINGDLALLDEVRALFVRDSVTHLAALEDSIARADGPAFGHAAHVVRGLCRALGASAAQHAVDRLENLAGDWPQAAIACQRLRQEFDALAGALTTLTRTFPADGTAPARPLYRIARWLQRVSRRVGRHFPRFGPRTPLTT